MDKKYVAISTGLIVFMIITIIIYNLTIKKNSSSTTNPGGGTTTTTTTVPKTTNGTVICTRIRKGEDETIEFTLSNNTLNNAKFKFTRDIQLYGYTNTSTLSQEDKDYIQKDILKNLGFESLYNTGVVISIVYTENVVIYIDVDFNSIGEYEYKKLGIEFEKTNFSATIKQLVGSGEYTCK